MLPPWETLPDYMQCPEVREYYEILQKKYVCLLIKRLLDIIAAILLLVLLAAPMLIIAGAVASSSKGPILFRQERVTSGGRIFRIYKFRTMAADTSQSGALLTVEGDSRITRIGHFLRKYRLDELPQLLNVLLGDMTFVGTRPEVPRYTTRYTPEMYATLLHPAGITSEASIRFREEDRLLACAEDPEDFYLHNILPEKMVCNLAAIRNFSIGNDILILLKTVYTLW